MPTSRFFNHVATLQAVRYPQDAAGGEVPTPRTAAVEVPACIQQAAAAEPGEGQARRGSEAEVTLFFLPSDPPQLDAVEALKVNDRVAIRNASGRERTLILDGPPFDMAGRGAVWEARARERR